MSKLGRKPDGQVSRVRNFDLEMFWREYESIEPRVEETHDEPDEPLNGNMTLNNNLYLGTILSHKRHTKLEYQNKSVFWRHFSPSFFGGILTEVTFRMVLYHRLYKVGVILKQIYSHEAKLKISKVILTY